MPFVGLLESRRAQERERKREREYRYKFIVGDVQAIKKRNTLEHVAL